MTPITYMSRIVVFSWILALCATPYAFAASIVPSFFTPTPIILNNGDDLTINAGTILFPRSFTNIIQTNGSGAVIPFITNNGNIFDGAIGIKVSSNTTISGNLTNNGRISFSNQGIVLDTSATISGSLINNGSIFTKNQVIVLNNGAVISGSLINTGDISGFAIDIDGGTITGGITNTGTLGDILDSNPAIRLKNLPSNVNINLNGGAVKGDILDENYLTGRSHVIIGGDITTQGNVQVSTLTVNAAKKLTLSANTIVTLNNQPNSSGTLEFGLNDSAANSGQLRVQGSGQGVNLNGATITTVVGADSGFLKDGLEISVAQGNAALVGTSGSTGQPLTTITDNSLLFDFEMADGGQSAITTSSNSNNLYIRAKRDTSVSSVTSVAMTPSTKSVAKVVDKIISDKDTIIDHASGPLYAASDAEAVDTALEAMLPATNINGAFIASQNVAERAIHVTDKRLASLRRQNTNEYYTASLNPAHHNITHAQGLHVWAQPFYQRINQGERNHIPGFEIDTLGMTLGADISNDRRSTTLGAALTYANSDINSKGANKTNTVLDSYQIAVYGDYNFNPKFYLSSVVAYTFGDDKKTRFNVGGTSGLNADSQFNSHEYTFEIAGGASLPTQIVHDAIIHPKIFANYSFYHAHDFTETGAGTAGLHVDSEDLHSLELGLGVGASWDLHQFDGSIFTPEIHLGYVYDVLGSRTQSSAQFIGGSPSFTTSGIIPPKNTVTLTTSLTHHTRQNWAFSVSYELAYKTSQVRHSGFMRFSYHF